MCSENINYMHYGFTAGQTLEFHKYNSHTMYSPFFPAVYALLSNSHIFREFFGRRYFVHQPLPKAVAIRSSQSRIQSWLISFLFHILFHDVPWKPLLLRMPSDYFESDIPTDHRSPGYFPSTQFPNESFSSVSLLFQTATQGFYPTINIFIKRKAGLSSESSDFGLLV